MAALASPACEWTKDELVVAEGEVRAQLDGLLQLGHGLVLAPAQPERPAHGPVRGGVALVGHEALRRGRVGPVDFRLARLPALERVLEMREGEAGMGAREGRIEAQRDLEELPRLLVVGLADTGTCATGRGGTPPTRPASSAACRIARLRSTVSISLATEATIRLPISSRTRNASSSL